MVYVLLCLLLLNEFPHWWKQSCIVFLFQVVVLQTFCRLMLSSTSLFPVCSFIPCLWLMKRWLCQCRMSSGASCMYVCNKDVLKKCRNKNKNCIVFYRQAQKQRQLTVLFTSLQPIPQSQASSLPPPTPFQLTPTHSISAYPHPLHFSLPPPTPFQLTPTHSISAYPHPLHFSLPPPTPFQLTPTHSTEPSVHLTSTQTIQPSVHLVSTHFIEPSVHLTSTHSIEPGVHLTSTHSIKHVFISPPPTP